MRLLAGLVLLAACRQNASPELAATRPAASSTKPAIYQHVKDSVLFRDAVGELCIRLPYMGVHETLRHGPYNYQPCVDTAWSCCQPLSQVLDIATFRRVPGTSNYWQDQRNIYADPWIAYPAQSFFFRVGRRREVHFLTDPDFIRCRGQVYYKGVATPNFSLPAGVRIPTS